MLREEGEHMLREEGEHMLREEEEEYQTEVMHCAVTEILPTLLPRGPGAPSRPSRPLYPCELWAWQIRCLLIICKSCDSHMLIMC